MARIDLYKTLKQPVHTLKKFSVLNPMTIHKKGTRAKALFALALVCFLWGTTWLASKQGVKYMPAVQLAGIRQLLGGLIYVVFFLVYKRAALPRGKEWRPVLILCFLNFIMSNALSTVALRYGISGGLGSIIGAIFPLWLVVIGLFSAQNKIPLRSVAGLLLGFGGVCIIFADQLDNFLNPDFRIGIALSVAATWTWAFATLYTKKEAVKFNPYFSLGLQMVISGACLLGFSKLTDSATNDSFISFAAIPWQSWAAIAYLVIFGSVIAFVSYLYALQHLPTEQASIYAYINPMVAVILGWLIFSEPVTVFLGIGGLVTLLGVYLVNTAYKK